MKKLAIITLLAVTVAACQTTDPYTREQKTTSATKGAVGGAVVGAVIGQVAGGDTESTLKGAAAGGAVGAGIGYYFDRQEAALREELERTGVGIKRVGENQLELVMPGNLTFQTSSSALSSGSYDVLNSVAKVLIEYDETEIFISGHTDSTGSASFNNTLSQERADVVYHYLSGRGVSKRRMTAKGYGSSRPIASNSTTSGRAQNRRVEIQIIGN